METLDWTNLSETITPKSGKLSYEENKQFFTKVAFDVFRINNPQIESLWILEEGKDGKQYLVATYSDENESEESKIEVKSSWMALADKNCENVTLLYKDTPIQRFASSEFGFNKDDVYIFQNTLIEKFSSDKSFVAKFIKSQPQEKQETILTQFPELA